MDQKLKFIYMIENMKALCENLLLLCWLNLFGQANWWVSVCVFNLVELETESDLPPTLVNAENPLVVRTRDRHRLVFSFARLMLYNLAKPGLKDFVERTSSDV